MSLWSEFIIQKWLAQKYIFRFSLKFFKTIKSATPVGPRAVWDGPWIPVQTHKYSTIVWIVIVKWMYSRVEISVGWAAGCLELLLCRWDESSNLLLKTSNNANNHFNNLKSTIIRILSYAKIYQFSLQSRALYLYQTVRSGTHRYLQWS